MDASLYLRTCLPSLLPLLEVVFRLSLSPSDDDATEPLPSSFPPDATAATAAADAAASTAAAPVVMPFFIAGAVVEPFFSTDSVVDKSLTYTGTFLDLC